MKDEIKFEVQDEVISMEQNIEWRISQRERVKEREKDYGWRDDVVQYLRDKGRMRGEW